jgi:hypothetical protein
VLVHLVEEPGLDAALYTRIAVLGLDFAHPLLVPPVLLAFHAFQSSSFPCGVW